MSAVMRFTYSDLKTVKTRSAFQVILEGPIEEYARFVEIFGGPMPGNEVPVALARLNEGADVGNAVLATPQAGAEDGEKPRRRFEDMPPSQQAGILCGDLQFHQWLMYEYPAIWGKLRVISKTPVDCAKHVIYELCDINSRSELDDKDASFTRLIFEKLVEKFRDWQGIQNLPEQRG